MAASRQYTALEWVIKEINETLNESQRVLENYANDSLDVSQLRFCQTLIHQVYGSLRMLGFHGAAMLAEEMEALVRALLDETVREKKEALEVLMSAILRLPEYLEQVQQTKQDYPALVLSLLNDIRSVMGASLLSESTLFTPNLEYAHQRHGKAHSLTENSIQLKAIVNKLRQMYQYAAASLFHGIDVDDGLSYLHKASQRLQKLLYGTKHHAVWEIASAVIDGLHQKIIEPSPSIKNLLRDLDGQLKQLEQEGVDALEKYPSDELLKNMLYYIGSSNTQSEAINQIKKRYQLNQLFPFTKGDEEGQVLPVVDAKTMRAVGSAIHEELTAIKARLSECLESGSQSEHLDFIQGALQRVNDTLAILGVGELRESINDTLISIASLRHKQTVATKEQLEGIAHRLTNVEVKLDRSLSKLRLPGGSTYQLDEAQTVVLEECRNGLENAKDAIVDYIASQWDIETIQGVPKTLRQVRGSLSILSLERAADILSSCILYIESKLIEGAVKPKWQQLDSLADVIASVDYYLEFISVARENDLSILDKAEKGLGLLGVAKATVKPFRPRVEETQPVPVKSDSIDQIQTTEIEVAEEDEIDAEVAEIFVEEYYEIMERLEEFFPQWSENFKDENALTETRRAFHTLKGSGRMVKANDIGELAWCVENMLNRVMDSTIQPGQIQVALIQRVLNLLPDMIEAFKTHQGNPHSVACEQLMTWAHQITLNNQTPEIESQLGVKHQELTAVVDREDNQQEQDTPSNTNGIGEKAEDPDFDPQLWEIFQSEAETHLAVVQEYIDDMEASRPFYQPPSDAMQRALHTLKGSAHMAELTSIAELMAPLEKFAKELRSYQVNIDDDIFQLIKDGVIYAHEALIQIEQHQYPIIEKHDQFIARFDELRERSVGHLIRQKEAEKANQKVDPAMLEVLMAEEMTLLLDADLRIQEWQQGQATVKEWQPLYDELVNLTQGAERANLPSMVSLSRALELVYQGLIKGTIAPSNENYGVLLNAHNQLMDIIDSIAAGQDLPPEKLEIIEQLQHLALVTDAGDQNDVGAQSDLGAEAELDDSEKWFGEPSSVDVSQPQEESYIATGQDEVLHIPENEPDSELEAISEPPLALDTREVDDEIVEIFLEEAHELLEELDECIHEWESGGDDRKGNEQMQRALHTFKGGARLAGLSNLGDTAHNFETYLIANTRGNQADNLFSEIHKYQDQLIRQVGMVNQGARDELPGEIDDDVTPEIGEIPFTDPSIGPNSGGQSEPFSVVEEAPIAPQTVTPFSASPGPTANRSSSSNVVSFTAKQSPLELFKTTPQGIGRPGPQATNANVAAARRNQPQEVVKVSADLMEELVNLAGETSISRGRMEEQISELGYSLEEMGMTVQRLQEQLRRLDIETEAQIIFRQEQMAEAEDFDPLEMDRYSQLQQLSRSLIESASDLMDLKSTLSDKTRDTETVLLQQSRINTDLQEGLMRSRMVPFSRIVPRLRRIVRQISSELSKEVNFELGNTEGELDRGMMERMVAPLEHMLRNSIDHGIEDHDTRLQRGKPSAGRIVITLDRDGGDVLIHVADDGGGIDVSRVRDKAIERHLMTPDAELSDQEILQFILQAGFSTAETVTQISGRGVGMDVVNSEIRQMGGSVVIDSQPGEGTAFTIRVPFTVSVNRALMVNMGEDRYAIPLNSIEGIVRVSPYELEHYYSNPEEPFEYAGQNYQLRYLGTLLDQKATPKLQGHSLPLPVLLVRSADHSVAVQVDHLQGSREIVVKSLGPQFKSVQGVSGATIMGDGHVVVILDLNALLRSSIALNFSYEQDAITAEESSAVQIMHRNPLVMVVDDSVTVRKVTTRLLEREGYDVVTAKDGVDAMNILTDTIPDIMLLDIEMPRMDGFEVAKNIRSSSRLNDLPIIMITSRTGEKHRQRGLESGANLYMGKPYQEDYLLESIRELISAKERADI